MQVDDPPYLSVGTAVSAKYKGAFCEAKVSKVDRVVKCKVTFRSGIPSCTVSDNEIKGTLRVGQQVQVKLPECKELVEAHITKIQDCSQYTVVFDDGDITTLRRTALCIKSGRHFNESETLDQLPLTHPEHFGIPVMGGRRGRRNRLLKDESSDEEIEEENEPDLEGYTQDIGRVVSVETGENKRGKEKWFPGLIVIPSAQPTVKINVKDEFLIRSFRDDRYYTVPKKEVNEFTRDITEKIESTGLAEAIQKANKFLDSNELPLHWEKSSLFNISTDSDSDDNVSDTSDEEQSEEKDRFVAQLYKFMDDSGTPLNKTPIISGKDIDLHRLFRIVDKMGGYNRVTNQNKWKSVSARMRLPINQNVSNQVKSVYKKCLLSYEGFFRTLGVTMSNPIRPAKKDKGRSLIRDKDRTPISSPKPERDDDSLDAKSIERKSTPVPDKAENKPKKKPEVKTEKDPSVKKIKTEARDASGDVSDSPSTSGTRPKRVETKPKEKKMKSLSGDKVKVVTEKAEDAAAVKVKDEKVQFTRSKSSTVPKSKESSSKDMVTTRQSKEATTPLKSTTKQLKKSPTKEDEDKDKKPKVKKKIDADKASESALEPFQTANLGDKLIVYYGPTNESKVTYEAKVVDVDKDLSGPIYLVHYTGWNTRYDEWIPASRIAENLSSGTKSKRSKVPAPVNVRQPNVGGGPSTSGIPRPASSKRNRVTSISSRGHSEDKLPRSSTPSSVTSSGSVSKSPATRSNRLAAKQDPHKRRFSTQTDVSVQSESDSEEFSESDADLPRTRSGSIKPEESEAKGYRKRAFRPAPPTPKAQKRKEIARDDNSEKDETDTERKSKRLKRSSDKSESDDEDSLGHPKGRDFDLNQIRSELKGFAKALKVPTIDAEKDVGSSSEESEKAPQAAKGEEGDDEEEEEEEGKEQIDVKIEEESKGSPKCLSPKLEPSSSSEDVYEFKEPEPFEFESRSKLVDDKNPKKRPRIFDSLDSDKSPRRRVGGVRSPLSPGKNDKLGLPEPRTYSRVPKKLHVSDDEESDDVKEEAAPENKSNDAFDKLIESPCFNIATNKPEKATDNKDLTFNKSPNLFKEAPESVDENSRDMDLSDCEFQAEIITREDTLFRKAFSKTVADEIAPDFSSGKTDEGKTTNSEDDDIRAQIQKAIAQSSSTDDETSNDLPIEADKTETLLSQPCDEKTKTPTAEQRATTSGIVAGNRETVVIAPSSSKEAPSQSVAEPAEDTNRISPPKRPIDPALQETDSSLLESIVSKPPLILKPNLDDTGKELTVKTGTKIADSILQKFNFIKNNIEPKKSDVTTCTPPPPPAAAAAKPEKQVVEAAGPSGGGEAKPKPAVFDVKLVEDTGKIEDKMTTTADVPIGVDSTTKSEGLESRKRNRKPISKPIIDESESDSSDSENLVIGSDAEEEGDGDGDDDDSRHTSSSDNKPLIECKNADNSGASVAKSATELASTQVQTADEEKKRSFVFDTLMLSADKMDRVEVSESQLLDKEEGKCEKFADKLECKEEQDPNLHSLLCEEEIPRSPAPPTDTMNPNEGTSSASVHEMPFASAPGSSNSKILLEPKKHQQPLPPPPPPLAMPMEAENRVDAQAVIENTPPTTPESIISNLSPRGDNGNISPNSNDSKSNEGENDYVEPRSVPPKVSPYSEEDTQAAGDLLAQRKPSSDPFGPPSVSRKRRGSLRTSEDGSSGAPKRGRKARQRRESDSDDASETSMAGSVGGTVSGTGTPSLFDRAARSPRPSKYNFMDLDPTLDNAQRIVVLQQKLADLRKTYQDVKAELAVIERRRKKIKRREREALKSAKQEHNCA